VRPTPFVLLALLSSIPACGGGPPSTGSRAAIAGWTEGEDQDTTPPSRTIDGREEAPLQRSRTIGEGGAVRQEVVRRGEVVDVAFSNADLPNAMRLLAEAAGVNVVVEDGLAGTVDLSMRNVRPLDAMTAIAQAHGATIEQSGRTWIVRRTR
jgi:hypothetical protein